MSARNELVTILRESRIRWATDGEHRESQAAQADAILAAGYSKPRTITTVEELDALPVGVVVMDGHGDVARKLRSGWRILVAESGWDAWLTDSMEETYLPATVLFTPKES